MPSESIIEDVSHEKIVKIWNKEQRDIEYVGLGKGVLHGKANPPLRRMSVSW